MRRAVLRELIEELDEAAAKPASSLPQQFAPGLGDTIYRRFFKGGIAVVLSIGCLWGALNLFTIAMRKAFGTPDLIPAIHAHANAMVFGWVGLFVMGFAYQSFPRLRYTKLWSPRLAAVAITALLASARNGALMGDSKKAPSGCMHGRCVTCPT